MENDKKSQVPNFSSEETEFLIQCVVKRLEKVGIKKAWHEVAECFLEKPCATNRSREQLLDKWKN